MEGPPRISTGTTYSALEGGATLLLGLPNAHDRVAYRPVGDFIFCLIPFPKQIRNSLSVHSIFKYIPELQLRSTGNVPLSDAR